MVEHPIVVHFLEKHRGHEQETVFRVFIKHQTGEDGPLIKSFIIEEEEERTEECLNLKNKWLEADC